MLPTLSEALRIAYSMDADAPADVQERQHHRNKMDRNAFHRALVTALTDPYTISGQRTAGKPKALEAKMERGEIAEGEFVTRMNALRDAYVRCSSQ